MIDPIGVTIAIVGLLLLVGFVWLCVKGEQAAAEQHRKDCETIENCGASDEVKQQMYAALFRWEADRDRF